MKALALFLSVAAAACYGAAPPKPPRVPLPPMSEGAELGVYSETKTTIENVARQASTCPAGKAEGSPECTVTKYTVAEPVTRTTTTASYGNEPITYAQFHVMTDPKWNEKLEELGDLSHKCQRANVPRYAGLALMLGGLVAGYIAGAAGSSTGEGIGIYGGLGLGAASYGIGYFAYGGRQCVEAQSLFNEMDMTQAMGWNSVEGSEYAVEMKSLAEQFNATQRGGGGRTAMKMRSDRQ